MGYQMVGIESADLGNSLASVATMLIDYGVPGIPVVENGIYVGMVFEDDLLKALQAGHEATVAADSILRQVSSLSSRSTRSEALRSMEQFAVPALPVTDDKGRVLGVITASRLIAANDRYARPKLVGGMATPSSVRLLGGGVIGGAPNLQVVLTGALMFLTYVVGSYLALAVSHLMPDEIIFSTWYSSVHHAMALLFFLLLLRAQPLAGYHAAEHMVVHAIEQSEPLEVETVSRMSRVHPRCGTNVAVAVGIFLGVSSTPLIPYEDVRMLLALLATLFLFRPIGTFVQSRFTTRPPTRKQLLTGIKAGKELLSNYQTSRNISPSIPKRVWQSGILHAMAGSMVTAAILYGLQTVLKLPMEWRVL